MVISDMELVLSAPYYKGTKFVTRKNFSRIFEHKVY